VKFFRTTEKINWTKVEVWEKIMDIWTEYIEEIERRLDGHD